MPELRDVAGLRVVADPGGHRRRDLDDGLDTPAPVLRFAPDEAFSPGSTSVVSMTSTPSSSRSTASSSAGARSPTSLPHIDWPLPAERPTFAQGAVAGVPAKLWLLDDTFVVLYTSRGLRATSLPTRLGWLPMSDYTSSLLAIRWADDPEAGL